MTDMRCLHLAMFMLAIIFIEICEAVDVTLTVNVAPGARECFSQDISANSHYEIEYQVISGGELDIVFSLDAAGSTKVFDVMRQTSNILSDRATKDGEYQLCFDNTFSHISTKTVFFRITVTEETNTTAGTDEAAEAEELLPFEITLENFKNSTQQVGHNLRKSNEIQRAFSQIELRDRSIQEYNFERVNFWSGLQLFVMVSVAVVNVLMIRKLFSDKHSSSSNSSKLRT